MNNNNEQVTTNTSVEQERDLLLARRGELLLSFVEAAQQKKPSKMGRVFLRLRQINEFLSCLERIDNAMGDKKPSAVRQYTVSSLFLHECYKALTADHDEQFFFLTGAIVNGINVLDQRLEFKHSKRSIVSIFSRDGYIRFFRLDDDLEIEIYGSGVEQHGKNSFRITAIS